MKKPQATKTIHHNQLLGAFPTEVRSRILPQMTKVDMKLGSTVCDAGVS